MDSVFSASSRLLTLHTLASLESTFGPLTKVLTAMQSHPERAATVRAEVLDLVTRRSQATPCASSS
jgi:hypothetical protein